MSGICDTGGMGRHSAPDDEGGQETRVVAVLDVATLLGRHAPTRPGPKPRPVPAIDEPPAPETKVPETKAPQTKAPAATELAADQVGLELIEDALAAVPAEAAPAAEAPAASEAHTAQIPPVVEPEPSVPEAPTAQIPLVEEPVGDEATASLPAAAVPVVAAPETKESRASSSDLALIRAHGDVRARCLAGVLVPFVLYVVVLVLIGSLALTTFLLWIWIPLISAGILVGLFLDAAHKRYGAAPDDAVSGSADRP